MKMFQKIALAVLSVWLSGAGALAAELRLTAPPDGALVPLLHPVHKAYLAMPRAERIVCFENAKKRRELTAAGNYPLPVTLSWEAIDFPEAEFTVLLSKTSDFTAAVKLPAAATSVDANNLMINQPYYWKVVATSGDLSVTSAVRTFRTEDQAPRLLRIDGVPNVRDLGGRKAMGGKRVKQGLVYRSTGLNDNATVHRFKPDELRESQTHAAEYKKIRPRDEALLEGIVHHKEYLEHHQDTKLLPYLLSPNWTAFRPRPASFDSVKYIARVRALRKVPSKFMGARAEKVAADANGCFKFAETEHHAPAIFLQEFESPEDGAMQMGCGADWYWEIIVNGELLYDMLVGNRFRPISTENHVAQVPVRKGKNLIAVLVRSGLDGWIWCSGPTKTITPSEPILTKMIQSLEKTRKDLAIKIIREAHPGKARLNAEMLDYMLHDLGIKSDLDLRNDDECYGMKGSPLGNSVTWFHYSSYGYAAMQASYGKEPFKKVFRVFLDPTNYPIVFHCIGGADRTGAVAFILNGLLGVDEEELYLDWEATGFSNAGPGWCHRTRFNLLIEGFQKLPGRTLHEKIENYVLDLGFTHKDIEKFRFLMLE